MENTRIKSLGIGSGVLTGDVIDKLKAADEKYKVKNIDAKIEKNTQKQKDLLSVTTLIRTFKSSVSDLSDETTYLQRKSTVNGKSVSVNVSAGVDIQSFTMDVKQLAQTDVYQSRKVKNSEDRIAAINLSTDNKPVLLKDGSFVLQLGSGDKAQKFTVNFNTNMSYQDLAEAITSASGGKIKGKMLNIGGDKPYQLIMQSKDSGTDNKITILPSTIKSTSTDSSGKETTHEEVDKNSQNILYALGWGDNKVQKLSDTGEVEKDENGKDILISEQEANHIQIAKNAEFKYNGISMSRSSNNFDDITVGIKFSLQEKGSSQVNIENDPKKIQDSMEAMVKAYNELVNQLSISTNYDQETRISGSLQGISDISSLKSTINSILFKTTTSYSPADNSNDDEISNKNSLHFMSIQNFGIEVTEKGILSYKPSKLNEGINKNFDEIKNFFVGKTKYDNLTYQAINEVQGGQIQARGDLFTINGKSIKIQTAQNSSAKDNALVALDAINQAGIKGIKATLNEDGTKLIIKATNGADIDIDGNIHILQKLGLSHTSLQSKADKSDGMFGQLNKVLDGLVGKKGSLTELDQSWTKEAKELSDEKKRNQEMINDKYERMEEKFARYDSFISKLNNQFSALQSMINAQLNSK